MSRKANLSIGKVRKVTKLQSLLGHCISINMRVLFTNTCKRSPDHLPQKCEGFVKVALFGFYLYIYWCICSFFLYKNYQKLFSKQKGKEYKPSSRKCLRDTKMVKNSGTTKRLHNIFDNSWELQVSSAPRWWEFTHTGAESQNHSKVLPKYAGMRVVECRCRSVLQQSWATCWVTLWDPDRSGIRRAEQETARQVLSNEQNQLSTHPCSC